MCRIRRSIIACAVAFIALICTAFAVATPIYAGGPETQSDGISADVTSVELNGEAEQGESCNFEFNFTVTSTAIGSTLHEGDQIKVEGNIEELFDADWDSLPQLTLWQDGTDRTIPLAYADVQPDGILFTIASGAEGSMEISGMLTTAGLTAKDLGLEEGESRELTLTVGSGSDSIMIKEPEASGPSDPSSVNPGTVDLDTFWKTAGSTNDLTGAWISMEVNPIGSMDLYGSTTYPEEKGERKPKSYENLYVEDEIPDRGFIDVQSVTICASIPTLKMSEYDFESPWHGNYDVPKGTYFAQRAGSQWIKINGTDGAWNDRMTMLEQDEGESKVAFKERILADQLQWGIYYDEATDTETFMCNFGNVGVEDNNNGIDYKTFAPWYVDAGSENAHPEIFGEEGASHGNVVTYHIEFTTYYPDIIGEKQVSNTATLEGNDVRIGGNTAGPYTINNNNGIGVARANELILRLVDEDDPTTPIADVEFSIERWDEDAQAWTDAGVTETTDADGRISIRSFPEGKYRVVQKTWARGYEKGYTAFTDDGVEQNGDLSSSGEFTITDADRYGVSSLIKNRKLPTGSITLTPQDMVAYTGGDSLDEDSFPTVRYAVEGASLDACDDITFTIDGVEAKAERVGDYWVLTALPNTFTLNAAEAEDDEVAGVYTVGTDVKDISADGEDGAQYTVNISGTATLVVRNVSDPEGVLENEVDVAQPVVASADQVDTSDGIGMAVIPQGTTYYTNGEKALGVLGDHESDEAQIALLFDKLIPTNDSGQDTAEVLRAHAGKNGYELTEDNSEFRYLDLVNENDGNAWMSTEDGAPITIYWPVPEGVDANKCSFQVLHFTGLHREYRGDMQAQVDASEVELIDCKVEGDNVVFTLTGDQDEGSFSPFALVWDRLPDLTPLNRVPSIEADDVEIYVGDPYDSSMHNASAEDVEDGDLTADIVLIDDGDVDNEVPGVYTVMFEVEDSQGARARTTATVTVLERKQPAPEEEPEPTDPQPSDEDDDALPTTGDFATAFVGIAAAAGVALTLGGGILKRKNRS